jgi:hypothetical protein
LNTIAGTRPKKSVKVAKKAAQVGRCEADLPAGGNHQIAKVDSDATVQAYIAAMPRWNGTSGGS